MKKNIMHRTVLSLALDVFLGDYFLYRYIILSSLTKVRNKEYRILNVDKKV